MTRTCLLLQFNKETPAGHIYTLSSLEGILDRHRRFTFYGELLSPDCLGRKKPAGEKDITLVNVANICVAVRNVRYEEDFNGEGPGLFGDVTPSGPKKHYVEDRFHAGQDVRMSARVMSSATDGSKAHRIVERLLAFDVIEQDAAASNQGSVVSNESIDDTTQAAGRDINDPDSMREDLRGHRRNRAPE